MSIVYNLGIALYNLVIALASGFNQRANLLLNGRKNIWKQLDEVDLSGKVIWIHAASLGEFEQGRPIIEAIKNTKPGFKIVLTFFSPSGYEVRKNYSLADVVVYLPSDSKQNARRFIRKINPSMAFFVKYEFWYHFFNELRRADIPIYSVSSIFRPNQIFFKWYGKWFRKTLQCVTHFYVQDEQSAKLLAAIGITNSVVAGDTRFDRVSAIAMAAAQVPIAASFSANAKVLVAGSTWPDDEEILAAYVNNPLNAEKLIVAPHEVHEAHVAQLVKLFSVPVCRFSQLKDGVVPKNAKVLIVDTIGLLSAIYQYGSLAFIGGGFGKGIHNTLEAATFGVPVVFGPNHKRFKEAVDLVEVGGGFSINNYSDFESLMHQFNNNMELQLKAGQVSKQYVSKMCGATPLIISNLIK